MGNKLILTGTTITDTTAPLLLNVDALETPALGSLALYEPGHPAGPYTGSLATGSQIPNLLVAKANALITAGTPTTLGAALLVTSDFSGTQGKLEYSTKGGIHTIVTGTGNVIARFAKVNGNSAVRDYLIANPTHHVFMSLWYRITRVPAPSGTTTVVRAQNGTWFNFYNRNSAGDTEYPTDGTRIGFRHVNTSGTQAIGPGMNNEGRNPTVAPTVASEWNVFKVGDPSSPGKDGAVVFYRWYAEDLTVSGRSYATVDALDAAEFAKQVTTVGGRYYGDTTPTDPATF